MDIGLLPSQFLSVVLEEDKNSNISITSKNITTSITIAPVVPKPTYPLKRKLNGKYSQCSVNHKTNEVVNGSLCNNYLDIKKKLPRTVLEECVVELANSSQKFFERTPQSSDDAIIIVPMYSKKNGKPKINTKKEKNANIRDIFNKVEAVYSDDEEQLLSVNTKVKNGVFTNEPSFLDVSTLLPYACDHCPNKYTNKGALWQHNVAAHSVEKSCECQLCGRKFYRNCSLALHMKCHSDEQNCSCKICGKEFNRLSTLERHVKCHNVEMSIISSAHICKMCNKKFSDELTLKTHILAHTEKFTCEQCNVTFNTKQLLDLHFHITHKRSETPFACKVCKARFANLRELNEHSVSHTYEKLRISCHHCGEVFTQRCTYKKHLQLHIGERLSCTICRIDFTQRSSLLRHYKRLHSINDIPNNSNIVETPSLTIIAK